MSEKDTIAKLQSALVAKEQEVAKLKADASKKDGAAIIREANEKAREDLRAKTLVTKDNAGKPQFAHYFIPEGGQLFYRLGVSHPPGSVVKLPYDELPSLAWEPVEERAAAKPMAPVESSKGKRPSDQDVA